jgi:hypothetical protein
MPKVRWNAHQIYLDKGGDDDNLPDTWKYFRVTSVPGMGVPEGEEGSTVQTCRVKWPSLEDIEPIVDSPGTVGYVSAYRNVTKILEGWGINREESILIGLRDFRSTY